MDGTILDTAKEFHVSLNFLLQQKKLIEKEFSSVRQIVSEGAGALISLGFSISDNHANFESLRKELIEEYEKICTDSVTFGGFEELIKFIKDNNKKWGIVTNKPKFLTDKISNFYISFLIKVPYLDLNRKNRKSCVINRLVCRKA